MDTAYHLPRNLDICRLLQLVEWGYAEGAPEITVSPHQHDFWQANWCISGKAEIVCGGKNVSLTAGTMLFLPPHCQHSMCYPGRFLGLTFKYYTYLHQIPEMLYLPADTTTRSIIQAAECLVTAMFPKKKLGQITGTCIVRDDHYQHVMESLLSGAIDFFVEKGNPLPLLAQRLHLLVHQKEGRPLSVAEVARHLGMSRNHLCRQVAACTGFSAKEFLDHERIAIATHYLKFSGLRMYEISDRMGFSSPSHFTRFFRRYLGKTPEQYLQDVVQTSV